MISFHLAYAYFIFSEINFVWIGWLTALAFPFSTLVSIDDGETDT